MYYRQKFSAVLLNGVLAGVHVLQYIGGHIVLELRVLH